ncbi:MAG: polymer-forming cytoskeletal protein [Planctomycetota bacterium]
MAVEQQRASPATRAVVCTHCEKTIDIPATAMSVSCRHCHRRVIIEDLEIKSYHAVLRVATAGRIEVQKKGTLVADVRANELAVEGNLKGNVIALDRVVVGKKASVEGDVSCRTLAVEPGARLQGHFRVDPQFIPSPVTSTEAADAETA